MFINLLIVVVNVKRVIIRRDISYKRLLGNAELGRFSLLSIALVWSGPTREKVSRHRLRVAVGSRRSPSCSSVENDGPTPPSKGLLQADDVYPMNLTEIDCFLLIILRKEKKPRYRKIKRAKGRERRKGKNA